MPECAGDLVWEIEGFAWAKTLSGVVVKDDSARVAPATPVLLLVDLRVHLPASPLRYAVQLRPEMFQIIDTDYGVPSWGSWPVAVVVPPPALLTTTEILTPDGIWTYKSIRLEGGDEPRTAAVGVAFRVWKGFEMGHRKRIGVLRTIPIPKDLTIKPLPEEKPAEAKPPQ